MNAHAQIHESAYSKANGRLASFADPRAVLTDMLDLLDPPSRISVVEAAEKYRVMEEDTHRGPWRADKVPSLIEPMNMSQSRKYTGLVFVGPARSSKTDSLILNRINYVMMCNPGRMMMVNMSQATAGNYSETEIARMIRHSPDLTTRQETGRGANNLYQKLFKGGGHLDIAWPVASAFAQKTLRDVVITERDRMPDDIEGEGDPFTLGRKRIQIAGSLGMCVEESSPSRPIKQRDWTPKTLHEAPPCDGILSDYNLGTRARRYWTCPHCAHEFEPDFEHLNAPDKGEIFERAQAVVMVCPESGCIISMSEARKIEAKGRWLHESNCGTRAVPVDDPDIRRSDILSYWHKGVQAAFQTWPKMMLEYLQALETFDRTGSEQKLQSFWNTTCGRPYLAKAVETQAQLNAEQLKNNATFRPFGEVPDAARFLTAQIDVQGDRFEVQVDAWGEGLQRWLVDRFTLNQPPANAPQALDRDGRARRPLQPALYAQDWDALDYLPDQVYPVTGQGHGLKIKALVIDRNGPPGATEKAYAFWRKRNANPLTRGRWFLIAGNGRIESDRVILAPPQRANNKYKRVARDVPIIKANTTLLKDEVCASLIRTDNGAGAYDLPATMEGRYFEEMAAELRTETRWEKRNNGVRNETFDLAYYGKALAVLMRGEQMNWDAPERWALPGPQNSFAVLMGDAPAIDGVPVPLPTPILSSAQLAAQRAKARVRA